MRDFATRLRLARERRGLSAAETARQLGVSRARFSAWERGKACPTLAGLAPLCAVLRVSADWLLDTQPLPEEYSS